MMSARSMRHIFIAPFIGIPVAGLLSMIAFNVNAQEATVSRSPSLSPALSPSFSSSLAVTQTLTDNRFLSRDDRQSELITQVSPSLHFNKNFGRIRGHLDYSLNSYLYASDTSSSNFQNSLNAALQIEAIENWAFINANALISQQSISAFGVQSPDPALKTSNQSEVSSYSIAPYVRGAIPGVLTYQAGANYSITRGGSFVAANSTSSGANAVVSSDRTFSRLGWSANVSRQNIDFDQGRRTESDRINGILNFAVNPDLRLSTRVGRESNNYQFSEKSNSSTWGYGVNWRPNERTRFSYETERRFFGKSHSLVLEYRTPKTVWNYQDSRDIAASSSDTRVGVTTHDLYLAQFASIAPDPVQRELLVNAFLLSYGINPNALVSGGFLTSAVSVQRRQNLSLALTGIRDVVILTAFKTENSALDSLAPRTDDLSVGGSVRQQGLAVNVSHRLTPNSAVNFGITESKSSATVGSRSARQRSFIATWTGRINLRTNLSITARHVIFDSSTVPYNESALIAGFTFQF